jgi:hypothetical protein
MNQNGHSLTQTQSGFPSPLAQPLAEQHLAPLRFKCLAEIIDSTEQFE